MELNDQSGYLFRPLSALYDGILRILRLFVWKKFGAHWPAPQKNAGSPRAEVECNVPHFGLRAPC